ncbi:hypothetical protein [Longimicrobium terrae]|nr:hypothetical protein [Longimicrobium terrae]NNC29319.1 hypothetical protein [Longimicrobium terrae]
MVEITIRDDKLIVRVMGLNVLLAMRRRLIIPLASVTEIREEPNVSLWNVRGFRLPGTFVPGLIVAGTYVSPGYSAFWDVSRPARAIVIELDGGAYQKLIVDVEHPAEVVHQVREAIAKRRS